MLSFDEFYEKAQTVESRLAGFYTETTPIVEEYIRFLYIKYRCHDWNAIIVSPSPRIDEVWHQHILDTRHYIDDVVALCDIWPSVDHDTGDFVITIVTLNRHRGKFPIDCSGKDLVETVKNRIESEEGIPAGDQSLIFRGAVDQTAQNHTLHLYAVYKKSTSSEAVSS
ncbi:hypothetical protein HDU88_002250 [Geranomyces variabilis]|nr:hypothetical protein HDU88_002250 [Geranomyces variabilis]